MVQEVAVLQVKDKTFKNDKGELIPFKECFVMLDGMEFALYPMKNKKELFKHCLKKELGE